MGDYEREQERLMALMEESFEGEPEVQYDDEEEEGEDYLEKQESGSDTEQELESDDDDGKPLQKKTKTLEEPFFIGKDQCTKWNKHVPNRNVKTPCKNIIRMKLPSVRNILKQVKQPLDIWRNFIDDEMINIIVTNTNLYLKSVSEKYCRETYARPTTKEEIEALLGLLLFSGVKKNNHLNADSLFKTDGTSPEIYRLTMSLQRFRILLRYLRFDDLETRFERQSLDKLAPIRLFFDKFVENCKSNYNISQEVTIDEKLEAFRSRCSFRQYMPNKPNKYGIKIFALCDSKMYYTSNLEVYLGTQPAGPFAQDNSALSVVDRLCKPIYGSGRNVTTDNWFTSFGLSERLLQKNLTIVGTIRKNKREIPLEFIQGKNRPVGSSMFGFHKNCTLVSYVPKRNKNVLLISSCHNNDNIDEQTLKPEIIIDYNRTKGGVDVVDKLCASYNCARATRRWQMVIFYSLLNISGINSQVIYCANNPDSKIVRRDFLEKLAFSLIEPYMRIRATSQNLPRFLRTRICQICKIEENKENLSTRNAIGRCAYCSSKKNRKTKYSCQVCNKFLCLEHVTVFCNTCSTIEESQE